MRAHDQSEILSPEIMTKVDRAAIQSGIVGYNLMNAAGAAVAACVLKNYSAVTGAVILCGPGNNGGDGYIVARLLHTSGMAVRVYSTVDPSVLKGDALLAFRDWNKLVVPIDDFEVSPGWLVVDALFGAGLERNIGTQLAEVFKHIQAAGCPVVSVDLPSGVSGNTGQIMGAALRANFTVTFAAPKPGHFLMPGGQLCGAVQVADIGIPQRLIVSHSDSLWLNSPALWAGDLPQPDRNAHKYQRGHLGVFSGGFAQTGAARIAASAGLRAGAGLVSVLSPGSAVAANAAHLTAVMQRKIDNEADLESLLEDRRYSAFVLGPGFGVGEKARKFALMIAESDRKLVLDADGISSFGGQTTSLFNTCVRGETRLVLTPHDGEFSRLFPGLYADSTLSKIDRTRLAAKRSNGVVLYKGADTVVAAPDGRAVINTNGPAWLATAGSGDCLAGIIGALLAQGMAPFAATAAAAYMHGLAGHRAGEGLTAETLVENIPATGIFSAGTASAVDTSEKDRG